MKRAIYFQFALHTILLLGHKHYESHNSEMNKVERYWLAWTVKFRFKVHFGILRFGALRSYLYTDRSVLTCDVIIISSLGEVKFYSPWWNEGSYFSPSRNRV